MKRLTYRDENGWVGVHNLDNTVSPTSVAIHKLAEFEDFMEEQGFESLENLKAFFKHNLVYNFKELLKEKFEIEDENQALKDRWNKLKEYVKKQVSYISFYEDKVIEALCDIEDKMQELEKEQGDE